MRILFSSKMANFLLPCVLAIACTAAWAESPTSVAVNPVTNMIYAADGASPAYVTAINGSTNAVIASIAIPQMTYGIAVNTTTNKIYVNGENTIYVIDGATNTIEAEILTDLGLVPGIVVDSQRNLIYIGCPQCYLLTVINGATNTIEQQVTMPEYVTNLAFNPTTNTIFVSSQTTAYVYAVNGSTYSYTGVVAGNVSYAIAANSSTNHLYIGEKVGNQADLFDINVPANTYSAISVAQNFPVGIAFNSSTNLIYFSISAETPTTVVAVINAANDSLVTTIPVGYVNPPYGKSYSNSNIAVNQTTNRIYVANDGSETISVIDGTTNTVIDTISVE